MELKHQIRNKDNKILRSVLRDASGNEVIVDTCIIDTELGATLDMLFEDHCTLGEIEMMVSLNGYWVNRSQRRYSTEMEAREDHLKIVDAFKKNGVTEILNFHEVPGGVGSFLVESDDKLKGLMKPEKLEN